MTAGTTALQQRWLDLTRIALPERAARDGWSLRDDHCFQRVVLDAVCGGRWYDYVAGRPAYRHLGEDRLGRAVALAERLATDDAAAQLLDELDARSLASRGKAPKRRSSARSTVRD